MAGQRRQGWADDAIQRVVVVVVVSTIAKGQGQCEVQVNSTVVKYKIHSTAEPSP